MCHGKLPTKQEGLVLDAYKTRTRRVSIVKENDAWFNNISMMHVKEIMEEGRRINYVYRKGLKNKKTYIHKRNDIYMNMQQESMKISHIYA